MMVKRWSGVWPCLALVGVVLAGCASAPAGDQSTATEGAGPGLHGVVVDAAIRPLAGVSVRLDPGGLNKTTAANGQFEFSGLKISDYTLTASKAGYLIVRTTVHAGAGSGDSALKLVLDLKPGGAKYANVYKFKGFYECGFWPSNGCANVNILTGIVFCAHSLPCFNVTGDRSLFLQWVDPGLDFLQTELAWTPTLATGKSLLFAIGGASQAELESGKGYTANYTQGESPLMVTLYGKALNESRIGYERALLVEVESGVTTPIPASCPSPVPNPCGVGVNAQQDFDVVTTAFYGYQPPAGWRFAVDGYVPPP